MHAIKSIISKLICGRHYPIVNDNSHVGAS